MLPRTPTLDGRDLAALLREALALRPFYTPEWRAAPGDAGTALLEIAAGLLEGTVQRLDQAPYKHFLAFLDLIGVQRTAAQSARAPLTFVLSEGAAEPVVVPARSQAAAPPADGGEPVVFETEAAFVATPARLVSVVSAAPAADQLFDHLPALAAGGTAVLFAGEAGLDLQGHALYLGHPTLFAVKERVQITLHVDPFDPRLLPPFPVVWEYFAGETEEIRGGETVKVPDWRPLGAARSPQNKLVLSKGQPGAIAELEIGGVTSRWIRCRVRAGGIAALSGVAITSLAAAVKPLAADGVPPDLAFANDVELQLLALGATPAPLAFYPFGQRPRLADTFYLASGEAFSKQGATITLRVSLKVDPNLPESPLSPPPAIPPPPAAAKPSPDLVLAWEYWDGKGWRAIPGLADATNNFSLAGNDRQITFPCPADLQPVEVLGQENRWIRVRITSGDYGRETFTLASGVVTVETKHIHPPVVTSLRIAYDPAAVPLAAVLTDNNLDLRPWDGTALLRPFVPLDAEPPALHLGFDRPLAKGPLSLFFALDEQEVSEQSRPRIAWQYRRRRPGDAGAEWARLEVVDETRGLTESGAVQFFAPPDLAAERRFGLDGWWIRAVDVDDRFRPRPRTPFGAFPFLPFLPFLPFTPFPEAPAPPGRPTRPTVPTFDVAAAGDIAADAVARRIVAPAPAPAPAGGCPPRPAPCAQRDPRIDALRNLPHPSLVSTAVRGVPPAPRLRGLFPNTAWAVQGETIAAEVLGSGTGLARQRFATARAPVAAEELWIDELGTLADGERAALAARPDARVRQRSDERGRALAFEVLWRPVEDLALAGPGDRVYSIDRAAGEIELGDGDRGRVAPLGRDNVRLTYRAGGGARGNVAAGTITALRTTIPLVDATINTLAATGGADTEPLPRLLERAPEALRHRGRAVSRADFEALAREASPAVARARCLPRFDEAGRETSGWVTVVIVPESREPRPFPTPGLRQRVERFLRQRAPNVVAFPRRVRVIGPAYVEVRVTAELVPVTADQAPAAEIAASRALAEFLHPLTGGYQGRGWEFGRLPCLSDFYAELEGVPGVDHVAALAATLQPVGPAGQPLGAPIDITPDRPLDATLPDYALAYSGDHRLQSRLPG